VSEPTATPKRKSKSETQKDVMSILLGDEIKAAEAAPNSPLSLDIADLVPYTNHPFKLYEGDRLDDMVRSIKELGVLMPVIVRPNEDETYEILSGHNRANAAKLAGLKEIPVIIKTGLSDDEAKLIVTETNLVQRSFADLSHSERAIALKQHMNAVRKLGKNNNLLNEIEKLSNPDEIKGNTESGLIVPKSETRDKAAEKYGLNPRSVSRYVRLCELNESLINRVDSDEIGLYPAVSISYLTETEQTALNTLLNTTAYKVDMKKAETLRSFSERKQLSDDKLLLILSGEIDKAKKPTAPPPLKIKHKVYSKYFSQDTKQSEMETVIDRALAEYFENHKEVND